MGGAIERLSLSESRVCVIMNRGSGSDDGDQVADAVTAALQPSCRDFRLCPVVRGSDLVEMARKAVRDGYDLIVACGGDGTQAAVAAALAGSDAVMGVLPAGTFNYFARDLGVGETIEDALETLHDGAPASIDIGQIENLVFLNNVSLGAYPHILKTRESIYRRWGRSRIAAYWSVLVALRRLRHPMDLTATIKGESQHFTTALVFVARSAYQLENFGLEGADAVRNGQFAVLIAKAKQPMPLMRSAFRLAFGQSAKDSDFDLIVTDDLTISTGQSPMLVAHDGEKTTLASPFHLRVWHDGLKVLLPADGTNKTKDAAS